MLGENIKNLRKENKISQEELAEKLGVSRQSISLWENEQTQPTIENIIAISEVFGIATDDILKTKTAVEADGDSVDNVLPEITLKKKKIFKLKYLWIAISIVVIGIATFFVFKGIFSNELSPKEIYELAEPATVEIQVKTAYGQGIGTGFFIDGEGTIVTNYHVIEKAYEGVAVLKNVGKFEIKEVIGFDEELDIAILKIDYKNEKFLERRTKQIEVGETVYALGSSEGLTNSFSSGIISALDRQFDGNHYIQVTAPISHGNSGGPLIDKNGKVIGITSAGIEDGQNLNLVIPITAIDLVDVYYKETLERYFELVVPKRMPLEELKAEVKSGKYRLRFICIDFGEYNGTVHYFDCPLISNLNITQENRSRIKAKMELLEACKDGYIAIPECDCVFD